MRDWLSLALANLPLMLAGCSDAPACLGPRERGVVEAMEPVNTAVRTSGSGAFQASTGSYPHVFAKVRMRDMSVRLCHISTEASRMFKVGEEVVGPWGAKDAG